MNIDAKIHNKIEFSSILKELYTKTPQGLFMEVKDDSTYEKWIIKPHQQNEGRKTTQSFLLMQKKKIKAFDKVQTCFHNKNTQQNRNRKARMTTFTTSIQHSTRSSSQSSLARKRNKRTSLEVQWLRFWDSTTGDTVSTPAQRTKIPRPRRHSQDFFFHAKERKKGKASKLERKQYHYLYF